MPIRILEGGLYKELSTPPVFVIHDGKKIHIPTEDALFALGYTWPEVVSVPDGSLDAFPQYTIESASKTPGSLIFPPAHNLHRYAKQISTSQRMKARIGGVDDAQLVEIRGWLVSDILGVAIDGRGNAEPAPPEPPAGFDVGFHLIPDYRWLEGHGVDINSLIMVGNFTISDDDAGAASPGSGVPGSGSANDRIVRVTPVIKCEINSWLWQGWKPPNLRSAPRDWIQFAPPGMPWPFLPGGVQGQYVSVYGSLITDGPHGSSFPHLWAPAGKVPREIDKWCPGWPWAYPDTGRDHLARWTEIHPVDKIQMQVDPGRHETVYGLLLTSNVSDCNSMTVTLKPEAPRPPNTIAAYKELIGSETRDPNNDPRRHYVRVTKSADHITVSANTCGDSLGSHGRIKAIYRLWWEPAPVAPPALRILSVSVLPTGIALNRSVLVTVSATDAVTGAAVAGKVSISGRIVGDTNVGFRYTFRAKTIIVGGRRELAYPKGTVVAPGFNSVAIDFDLLVP
jgi:hypothetical protein